MDRFIGHSMIINIERK